MLADDAVRVVDDLDLTGVVAVGVEAGGDGDGVNAAVRPLHADDIAGLHLALPVVNGDGGIVSAIGDAPKAAFLVRG